MRHYRGGSNEYPQSMFEQKYEKFQNALSENLSFFGGKIFTVYLNRRVFVMTRIHHLLNHWIP